MADAKDSSAFAEMINVSQDGSSLKGYKIPKKKRGNKFDYRESSDSETDPYEASSDDGEYTDDDEVSDYEPAQSARREQVSDVESDSERFDPLEKSEDLTIRGGKARYVDKYFNKYVNESTVKENVLEDAPVPSNSVFTPPNVDDFVEDLISDRRALRFLKIQDNSLKFVQKKVAQIMGPLYKVWNELDGANQGKETSSMSIQEVLNLVERTVLLVGQVNVACLHERRINFMAKILKGTKSAKETLAKNQDALAQPSDTLFGESFYNILERKSKNRKRAREMAKEMGLDAKRRKTDKSPFRGNPAKENQTGGFGRGKEQNSSTPKTHFHRPGRKTSYGRGGRKTRSEAPKKM